MPLPADPLEALVLAITAGWPRDEHQKIVSKFALDHGLPWDGMLLSLSAIHAARDERKPAAPPRNKRQGGFRAHHGFWCPTRSLDSVINLSPGAGQLLSLIMCLAGQERRIETHTCSLATKLGRSARHIQRLYRELVSEKFIAHEYNRRAGCIVLTILKRAVRPPPKRREGEWSPRERTRPTSDGTYLRQFGDLCRLTAASASAALIKSSPKKMSRSTVVDKAATMRHAGRTLDEPRFKQGGNFSSSDENQAPPGGSDPPNG